MISIYYTYATAFHLLVDWSRLLEPIASGPDEHVIDQHLKLSLTNSGCVNIAERRLVGVVIRDVIDTPLTNRIAAFNELYQQTCNSQTLG